MLTLMLMEALKLVETLFRREEPDGRISGKTVSVVDALDGTTLWILV